ncbi:MAG: hypothetical protein AB7R89_07170 [Dehalococcoidia bacterium]
MRRREQPVDSPSNRENISFILQIFGLGPAEQHAIHMVSAVAIFFSRLKVRFLAGLIPATVFMAVAAYAAGAVALAVRKERAAGGR